MSEKTAIEILNQLNLKVTQSRLILLDILLSSKDHLSIDDILNKVKEEDPDVGIATVYRTLKLLEDNNYIAKHVFKNNTIVYENTYSKKHHHHLVDIESEKILEFDCSDIDPLLKKRAEELGYEMTGHIIEIYGKKIK
tara:strand:- start:4262 stop:4675 length:414 start_codon:yes stop_codon:yes gene_type:complete